MANLDSPISRKRKRCDTKQVHFDSSSHDRPDSRYFKVPKIEWLDSRCREKWYHDREIASFRKEVANLLVLDRARSPHAPESFFGLERHTLERSNAKRVAIRTVVKAQGMASNTEWLRVLAEECSKKARKCAGLQGIQDFLRVYYDESDDNWRTPEYSEEVG